MAKVKTAIPFQGTAEQEKKLLKIITDFKGEKGAMMPVLQKAQELYGYLPIEVQKIIAEGLEKPLAEVYGVVSFYSQFTLNPKGEYKVSVCLGTACYVKGSGAILDKIKEKLGIGVNECSSDMKFSLDATRCVGACGLAPVMLVNDDVFGRITVKDVDTILDKYM